MRLYVMRHGIALDVGEEGVLTDAERPLSSDGRCKTTEVAKGLAAMGVHPDHVGTSPLVRAEQTARLAAGVLCQDAPVETCEFLLPGGRTADLVRWIRDRGGEAALVVGHMPDLSRMISELIGGKGAHAVELKKAGVACVAFEEEPAIGQGWLEWLMQPAHLRRMRE